MRRRKLLLALLVLYGFLVLYSVMGIAVGISVPAFMTPVITLTGFIFALLHASDRLGWKKAALLLVFVFVVALLFESVGVATGLVYGPYHYTEKLGPKFLDLVPYLIAVAWFMMMYPSFVMAEWLVPSAWTGAKRLLSIAAVGGLIMTAWDVVMDPIMVAGQHWIWEQPGAFFGVPLQNYWGWWLTVFTTFVIYLLVTRNKPSVKEAWFDRQALIAFMITGFGNVFLALFAGLPGPGLAGVFSLTPWVIVAWISMGKSRMGTADSQVKT
jgi:putative membrane protein